MKDHERGCQEAYIIIRSTRTKTSLEAPQRHRVFSVAQGPSLISLDRGQTSIVGRRVKDDWLRRLSIPHVCSIKGCARMVDSSYLGNNIEERVEEFRVAEHGLIELDSWFVALPAELSVLTCCSTSTTSKGRAVSLGIETLDSGRSSMIILLFSVSQDSV